MQLGLSSRELLYYSIYFSNDVNSSSSQTVQMSDNEISINDIIDNLDSVIPPNIRPCSITDYTMKNLIIDKKNKFFIMHLNISSLQKHFDELYDLILNLTIQPDILCITETRIADVPLTNIELPGYKFFHCNSPTVVGGVAIYIQHDTTFDLIKSTKLGVAGVEEMWLEFSDIDSFHSKRILGCIYRHPSCNNEEEFLQKLNDCLADLNLEHKQYYIIGDMNVNTLLNNHQENLAKKYNLILKSNNCFSVITTATRVTHQTETLLDHILTNEKDFEVIPGVIDYHISDHSLTFAILKTNQSRNERNKPTGGNNSLQTRNFKNFEAAKFCDDLNAKLESHMNLSPEINPVNFNLEFDKFNQCILNVINRHAPFSTVSRKHKRLLQKPWITKGIFTSIRHKQKLYNTHYKSGDTLKIDFYKRYANKLTHLKTISKKNYFHDEINEHRSNPKKLWETLRLILPASKKHTRFSDAPTKLRHEGKIVENVFDVVEKFNKYFANVGKMLADKIITTNPNHCKSYLQNRIQSSIFLNPPQSNEIFNIINSLKCKKSAKNNAVPSYFIKIAGNVLAPYLAYFYALSFEYGIFPDALKIAAVTPIYKTDDELSSSNYRPISVLPCLSKILEKLIKIRIISFLEKNHVFNPYQYGFRAKHSTTHALLDITTSLYDNLNKKILSSLVLLDLRKAFNTVSHQRLLLKLGHYGIRGIALQLLTSYLSDRMQFVNINNVCSNLERLTMGVPQGSILGPLLYIIYVNDFQYAVECTPRLYADDTCLLIEAKTVQELQNSVNNEMIKVTNWMISNQLTINPQKSSLLIIQPTLNDPPIKFQINIDGYYVNSQNSVKYLGIYIDHYLNFKFHTEKTNSQIARATGILWRVRKYLPAKTMLSLYYTLVQPHLLYGLTVWGSTSPRSSQKQLQLLQNNAVRAIVGCRKCDHISLSYKNLNILKVHDLCKLEIASLMYLYEKSRLPTTFNNKFIKPSEVHQHTTRSIQELKYYIPRFRLTRFQKSFTYTGVKIWNNIEKKLKQLSYSKFRNTYKALLSDAYNT